MCEPSRANSIVAGWLESWPVSPARITRLQDREQELKEGTANNNKPLLQDSAGSAGQAVSGSIYGVPVYLSSQLSIVEGTAESSAYVYDASQVVVVMRQDTRIELDRSRLFNSDQSEIRAILRADLAVPNPKAVVRISKFV